MINPTDKILVRNRFAKNLKNYESQAFMQKKIAEQICQNAAGALPAGCRNLMEIGCGTGLLSRMLSEKINIQTLHLNDLLEEAVELSAESLTTLYPGIALRKYPGDAESIAFPDNLDGLVSSSCLQWMHDLPTLLGKISRHLLPGGYLGFNVFGTQNLFQIKELTGAGLPYPEMSTLHHWLSSQFIETEIYEQYETQTFETPLEILHHLKHTGVTGTGPFLWTREKLNQFEKAYRTRYSQDGGNKVLLTWHVIFVSARKKY